MAQVVFNPHACKGCGLCVSACPKKIIDLDSKALNEKDREKCIVCGFCATICPDVAIKIQE